MNSLQSTKHFLILLGLTTFISFAVLLSCDNMMDKTNEASDTNIKNSQLCIDTLTLTIPGSIKAYMGETVPEGWLECNGAEVSKSEYPDLYAVLGDRFSLTGDSDTTFRLPDLRGVFLRGWDNGRGLDPDIASRTNSDGDIVGDLLGSFQDEELKEHKHGFRVSNEGASGSRDPWNSNAGPIGDVSSILNLSATHAYNPIAYFGGSETRPVNVSVMYIISIGKKRQVIVPCEQ